MTTKLLIRLNRANIITINPADLKKIPERLPFWILNEEKLIRARTGNVPSAKESIDKPPFKKLPVESVYICIDCVKPQGKKKVATPTNTGVKEWLNLLTFSAFFPRNFGIDNCNFLAHGKTSSKLFQE